MLFAYERPRLSICRLLRLSCFIVPATAVHRYFVTVSSCNIKKKFSLHHDNITLFLSLCIKFLHQEAACPDAQKMRLNKHHRYHGLLKWSKPLKLYQRIEQGKEKKKRGIGVCVLTHQSIVLEKRVLKLS